VLVERGHRPRNRDDQPASFRHVLRVFQQQWTSGVSTSVHIACVA
jgi:hypothetical protein